MRLQGSKTAKMIIGMAALSATLALILGSDAHARDRYRCFPAGGGESYTVTGSCRSQADSRAPLSAQEVAEFEALQNNGRRYVRCTAADGSYSFFLPDGNRPCPAANDTRTDEYAVKGQSTRAVAPSQPVVPVVASPPPAPEPVPVPVAPVVSPAAALPATRTDYQETKPAVKILLLMLAGLGIAWAVRAYGTRPAGRRSERAQAAAKRRNDGAEEMQSLHRRPEAKGIDMQQKAQEFLAALRAGTDVPGGLAFLEDLKAARLDYSAESLDRLDQLLYKIKTGFSPKRETWQARPGAENLCLLLAFYLGEMVSRQTQQPIKWHTREQAAPFFPANNPLPVANWSRLVGIIASSICIPLGFIEDSLFGDSAATTSKAFVAERVAKLPKPPPKDENERCTQMLEAFFNDGGIVGTLAYREQLEYSRMDHSLASLERLDQLLRSIRDEIKPTFEEFVNQSATQNFVRFVAFYIGMTTAGAGRTSIKWLDFEQTKKELPELQFQFDATSVCLLNGRFYFLLGLVTEILFDPEPKRNLTGWAHEALSHVTDRWVPILRQSAQLDNVSPLDPLTVWAINRAGFVAAWGMNMVEGGSVGSPLVLVPAGDGTGGIFTDFTFYSTLEAGVEAAHSMMKGNPHHVPFQVMSHDAYANLHTGRTDALKVELRIYVYKNAYTEVTSFEMTVTCPYRNANDPKGFAIYSPKLIECSAPAAVNDAIFKHFYLGVAEFRTKGNDWFKYLDERI